MFPASLNLYHQGIGAGEIPHPNPPLKGEGTGLVVAWSLLQIFR
ncbi:hypothetical protein OSU_2924 [Vibrio cholerae PS15]|nr:hypothetical protein OSU_2924 [Vibrio cholerae PS15]